MVMTSVFQFLMEIFSICRCGNKFLEFLRSSAVMTDYQRIKLQEQDSNNAGSRIPRTFEVEVRGSLVNLCITGDLLTVVGIVKTIQVRSANEYAIMFG